MSRKWIMGLLIILLASVFLFLGTLPALSWVAIVGTVYSGYLISNVTQKGVLSEKDNI